jgi:hypothetical protein
MHQLNVAIAFRSRMVGNRADNLAECANRLQLAQTVRC